MVVMACVKESSLPNGVAGFIQEEQKEYMNHNQLFKELISNFYLKETPGKVQKSEKSTTHVIIDL